MKVTGLDDREYNINVSKYKHNTKSNASKLHIKAKALIEELFPMYTILEEVVLPGSKIRNQPLSVDFFIPAALIMIEVQGQQHYEYNTFHYKNKMEFIRAKKRDVRKREWCRVNEITLIELPYNEDLNEWRDRINGRTEG